MSNKVHVGLEMGGDIISQETTGKFKKKIQIYCEKTRKFPRLLGRILWKVGRDDPRRVMHSLKVGLSLTLVSLLYLMEPLFKGVGSNAMWAVMTVVVVLEFSAGATLCKGLNRGLGTLLAGSLAFFIEYVASVSGRGFRAVFIGVSVFLIGTLSTYVRFIPYIKKNYDYGVLIFLLTFNLITVSSFRVENVLKIAHDRFYTIALGCGICLVMTLLVFPIWSGSDLHKSTVAKLEGLAKSIEGCVLEYFTDDDRTEESEDDEDSEDPIYKGYKGVLDSKSMDESLALYASWEPRHTKFCLRFPWQQYVKLGAVLRHFGYTVVALHGCLQTEIQTPRSVRALFKDPCMRLAAEVSKVLKELGNSIKNRRHCSPEILSDKLNVALQDLNTAIKSQPKLFLGTNLGSNSIARNASRLAPLPTGNTPRNNNARLPTMKTDTSALREWKLGRKHSINNSDEKKTLRPQLSKIAVLTSLEFSEALPFAAFASLLVEIVARLDTVIGEVEELGRIACFKEYSKSDDTTIHGDHVVVNCGKSPHHTDIVSQNHFSHGAAD